MKCEDFAPFIDAYVDQELDEQDLVEMEIHLAHCDSCRERVSLQLRMKEGFKACLGQEKAPDALRERIFSQLEEISLEDNVVAMPEVAKSEDPSSSWLRRLSWVAAPLAAAVALVIVLPAFTVAPASSGTTPVVEQTIDWHQGNFPIEVTGPDADNVSRWFRNKVDFPVRPLTFASQRHANLLGGRIAHVQDRRAAYLLYEVDGTRLSVLVFDGQGMTVPAEQVREINGRDVFVSNRNGYEVAVLQKNGVTYAVTSELPEDEFLGLVGTASP